MPLLRAKPGLALHGVASGCPDAVRALLPGVRVYPDAAEAERLLALAREAGRMLTAFHNRRWDGDFLTMQAVVRSGRVGRPVQLDSHFDRFRPAVRDRWRERPGPGGGIWYDLGPHLIDQALQLFGPPRTVLADLAALRDRAEADDMGRH